MGRFTTSSEAWSREAFSFRKACAATEIWIGLISFFSLAFLLGGSRLVFLLPIWFAFMLLVKISLEKGLWHLLPAELKDQIPYDDTEAKAGKGRVRSYRELVRAVWGTFIRRH